MTNAGTSLETVARRLCLQNAVLHGGKANAKGLVGRVMGSHPEFRTRATDVAAALEAAALVVNAMDGEAQKAALEAEAPEMLTVQKKERRTGLKELPNVKGKVVMRFAPNPNGPLSLGHSRGVSILAEYWKAYDADLILRFDDTDPQVKPPLWDPRRGWNGYQMIRDDFQWLTGRTPSREVVASDRIPIYQQAARELIRHGGAYVCSCDAQVFRDLKAKGEACPHRGRDMNPIVPKGPDGKPLSVDGRPGGKPMAGTRPEVDPAEVDRNLTAFDAMCDGTTQKGAAVLRIKTDIRHRDPALRDWTAFRVVAADAKHPRESAGQIPRYHAWPLLDFQSAIEDHLQGVTHVIRGKDLMDSTRKQTYLYAHMGWTYPETLYWGRVSVHEFGKFSTSMMRRAIESGKFTGWDDPRLPTLSALRRRGYTPGAIRAFWVGMGLTEKDTAISMANLEAEDGKAIDDATPRYFFVPDATAFALQGVEPGHLARPAIHPGHPERGTRTLPAESHVLLPGNEVHHPALRLKDLGNAVLEGGVATLTGTALDRSMPIVQWLPQSHARPFTILKPEYLEADEGEAIAAASDEGPKDEAPATGKPEIEVPNLLEVHGMVEAAALRQVGHVVQFERVGFVRVESETLGIWLHH